MVTTLPAPEDDPSCGWFHLSRSRQWNPVHEGSRRVRWAIVGAGLTGLVAARRLATRFPDDELVLAEAQQVSFGSPCRNSGFVIDLPHDIGDPGIAVLESYRNEIIDFLISSAGPATNPPEPLMTPGVNVNLWYGERRADREC